MSAEKINTQYIKELHELIKLIDGDLDIDMADTLTDSLKERLTFEITGKSISELVAEEIEGAEEIEDCLFGIENFNTDDVIFKCEHPAVLSKGEEVLSDEEHPALISISDIAVGDKLDEIVSEFKKETENRHLLDLIDSDDIKIEEGVKIYYTLLSDMLDFDSYPAEVRDEVLEDISILDSDIVFNYKFEDNSFNSEMHVIRLKDSIWFIERPNVLIFH